MVNAILTGSHKYGKPRAGSDIDLVVLLSEEDFKILQRLGADGTTVEKGVDTYYGQTGTVGLKFGPIHLLCCADPLSFHVWAEGTEALTYEKRKRKEGVPREAGIKFFDRLRQARGVFNHSLSAAEAIEDHERGDEEVEEEPEEDDLEEEDPDPPEPPFRRGHRVKWKTRRGEINKGKWSRGTVFTQDRNDRVSACVTTKGDKVRVPWKDLYDDSEEG